jgi:HK97 gp10 family phage protein
MAAQEHHPAEVKATVNLNGLEEKLQALGPKLARKALRKAVAAVGEMWIKEMQARVPNDTGDLRESISMKVTTKTGRQGAPSQAKVSVGPAWDKFVKGEKSEVSSQQAAVYAMFSEFGTKRERARPWMRPTFDATKEKAVQILADTLRDDLDDAIKS